LCLLSAVFCILFSLSFSLYLPFPFYYIFETEWQFILLFSFFTLLASWFSGFWLGFVGFCIGASADR